MRKFISIPIATSAIAVLGLSSAIAAEPAQPRVSEAEFTQEVAAFAEANPGDVAGLEAMIEDLGGEAESSTATLTEAELADPAAFAAPGAELAANPFPQDVFTVNIVTGTVGDVVILTGSFDWRDNFAGQADPLDIASLRISDACGGLTDLTASTRDLAGAQSNRATLRESGVGTNAPVWNVDATTSGFANQADRGSFQFRVDTSKCAGAGVQAAFEYEGNQGGSITSVSASWAGLSIGYSNPGLVLKKSTPPISVN